MVDAHGSRWSRPVDLSDSLLQGTVDFTSARFDREVALDRVLVLPLSETGPPARLDLSETVMGDDLSLRGAAIAGEVSLAGASVAGDLLLDAPEPRPADGAPYGVAERVDLSGVDVGGDARLGGLRLRRGVALDDARIGGRLDLSAVSGPGDAGARLEARRAQIGEGLALDDAWLSDLLAERARIGGQISLDGVTIDDRLDLHKSRIGGDVSLRPTGRAPTIGGFASFNNARIEGRIDASGLRIGGDLMLDAARIGEDLWLRQDSAVAGEIIAVFARFGQNVDLSGSDLGVVDLTGAEIGGELRLGAPDNPRLRAPRWGEEAGLTLRNARVAAWVDVVSEGPADAPCPEPGAPGDPWPPRIDVIGFAYDRIGGLGGGDVARRERCGWYVAWLDRQQPFSLDPYRRLADHLDAGGRAEAARSVRYAAKERQLAAASFGSPEYWRLFLQKIFVGYGVFTYFVFVWMLAFVVLGAFIFSRTPEARVSEVPLGLVFSLDMLLPFLSFRRAHGDVDLKGRARYYLYFHKFMGWVFALFFASALGGLFAV